MSRTHAAPESTGVPVLTATHFIDEDYSRNHARMFHSHTSKLELFYVHSGEGWYYVGGRLYPVHAGCMVICNSDTLHGESPFQPNPMRSYCIVLKGIEKAELQPNHLTFIDESPVLEFGEHADTVHHLMQSVHLLYSEKNRDDALCQQLALSILMMTERELKIRRQTQKETESSKSERLLQQITQYLDENYMNPITLEEISGELHVSISRLSHLFKQRTGMSPMQYVIYRRIGSAQTMLIETDEPIHIIEEQLGFGSSCHLTTMFKKYVGIAPKEYRKYFQNHQIQ